VTPAPQQSGFAARVWHAIIAVVAAFALTSQAWVTLDRDRSFVNFVSYFTVESNVLVLATCVCLAIRPDRDGTAFGILRLGSLTCITVTGIVYVTVLAGEANLTGIERLNDVLFHYVVPVMSIIGFLAFRPRTRLDRSPLWFVAFPVAWLVYTLLRADLTEPTFVLSPASTAPVPYGFLDVGENGVVAVAAACVVVTLVLVGVAVGYLTFTRRYDSTQL
jgi:hypothetical protein